MSESTGKQFVKEVLNGVYKTKAKPGKKARPFNKLNYRTRLVYRLMPAKFRVVDVGGGVGKLANALKKKKCVTTILDISEAALKHYSGPKKIVDLDKGIPFRDKTFDAAVCMETLDYVENPFFVLQEIARVTKKKVYIADDNYFYIGYRFKHLFGGHAREITYHGWMRMKLTTYTSAYICFIAFPAN